MKGITVMAAVVVLTMQDIKSDIMSAAYATRKKVMPISSANHGVMKPSAGNCMRATLHIITNMTVCSRHMNA